MEEVMEYEELIRVRTLVNGSKRYPHWSLVMSYIIQRMPRKGRCRISIVLSFSWGRAKTIRIHLFFRKRKGKNLRFQKHRDTCGDGLNEGYYIFVSLYF